MVHKKLVRDSRITFTIRPDIEKKVRAKVTKEKETLSGVIVSLLEGWLSGAPLPGRDGEPVTSPSPPPVDIEQLKKDIMAELRKEISTEQRREKAPGPVQLSLIHTDMIDMNQSIEAPTSPDKGESHTFIPPEKDTAPSKGYGVVNMGNPTQEEREKLSDDIVSFKADYQNLIDSYRKEHGLKSGRESMKILFGFSDSEVSTMKKVDASLTRKKYLEYQTLMAEARKKYVLV